MRGGVLDGRTLQRRADALRRDLQSEGYDDVILLDDVEEESAAASMTAVERKRAAARLLEPIVGDENLAAEGFSEADELEICRMSWELVTGARTGQGGARFCRQAAQHAQTTAFVHGLWGLEGAEACNSVAAADDDVSDDEISDDDLDAAFEDLFDFLDAGGDRPEAG